MRLQCGGCGHCFLCKRMEADPEIKKLFARKGQCIHLGSPTGSSVTCPECNGRVELKLYNCGVYSSCTLGKHVEGLACCLNCPGYTSPEGEVTLPRSIKWAYGVTTVPSRRDTYLPTTLRSLAAAGFEKPRLFVDGAKQTIDWEVQFKLEVTARWPPLLTHGNWVLALYELYIREPAADRYAVFQDDLLAVRNLRKYLEQAPYPDHGYCNLFTFPRNQKLAKERGWFLSDQKGKGAVGLVFCKQAVLALLSSRHMVERPMDSSRGTRAVDGGVVCSLAKAGWKEYCHNPSLIQHIGDTSSMGNNAHLHAETFPGEEVEV